MNLANKFILIFLLFVIAAKADELVCSGDTPILDEQNTKCISEAECTSDKDTLYLYNGKCTLTECPSQPSSNTPGYQKLDPSIGVTKCIQCSLERGIGGASCSLCQDGKILDYASGTCLDLSKFSTTKGIWSLDQKIVYSSPSFCENSTTKDIQITISKKIHTMKGCDTCSVIYDIKNNLCLQSKFDCTQLVNNKMCQEACPLNNKSSKVTEKEKFYSECVSCEAQLVSPDKSTCVTKCTEIEGSILNKETGACIMKSDCTTFIGLNSSNCQPQCEFGTFYDPDSKGDKNYYSCQKCDKYAAVDYKSCVASCPSPNIPFQNQCIASIDSCNLYLSVDEKQCQASCSDGQYFESKEGKSYLSCLACPQNTPYTLGYGDSCIESCDPNYILKQGSMYCYQEAIECPLLSSDGKMCVKSCNKSQYQSSDGENINLQCTQCATDKLYTDSNQDQCYNQCADNMISIGTTYLCVNKYSACSGDTNIISTSSTCTNTCEIGEIQVTITQTGDSGEDQSYVQCEKCPSATPNVSNDQKQCFDKCNKFVDPILKKCLNSQSECKLFIQSDNYTCSKGCPIGQARMNDNDEQNAPYKYCKVCTSPLEYLQVGITLDQCVSECKELVHLSSKICITKTECLQHISSDGKKCVEACEQNEFVQQQKSQPYKNCLKTCEGYSYTDSKGILQCVETCPDTMITNNLEKICLKDKTECKKILSADSKECKESCDLNKQEYLENYKSTECKLCTTYLRVATSECVKECSDKEVTIIPSKTCVSFDDREEACKNYKISSNQKKCTNTCEYPDLTNEKNKCQKVCSQTDSTCQNCGGSSLLYSDFNVMSCITKDVCTDKFLKKISANSKECVDSCQQLSQIVNPTNKNECDYCKNDEIFILNESSVGSCKKQTEAKFEDQKATIKKQLDVQINSPQAAQQAKSQLSSFSASINQQLKQLDANPQENIDFLQSLVTKYLVQISNTDFAADLQVIGNKQDILTVFQSKRSGHSFRKSFSFESLLQSTPSELLEIETASNPSSNSDYISASIFKNNPACSSFECQSFPLIQVKANTFTRRILDSSSPYTMSFTVDKASHNYICLSYDLNKVNQKPTQITPTVSQNGLTLTCTFSSNVQLFLDSNCNYLDKSNCPKKESDESKGSNKFTRDQIAAIAFGIVVVFIIVLFILWCLIRRMRLKEQATQAQNQAFQNSYQKEELDDGL